MWLQVVRLRGVSTVQLGCHGMIQIHMDYNNNVFIYVVEFKRRSIIPAMDDYNQMNLLSQCSGYNVQNTQVTINS